MPDLTYQLTAVQIQPSSARTLSVRIGRMLGEQGIGEVWVDVAPTPEVAAAAAAFLALVAPLAGQCAEVGGAPLTVASPPSAL